MTERKKRLVCAVSVQTLFSEFAKFAERVWQYLQSECAKFVWRACKVCRVSVAYCQVQQNNKVCSVWQ